MEMTACQRQRDEKDCSIWLPLPGFKYPSFFDASTTLLLSLDVDLLCIGVWDRGHA